jgi:hypothetical protein
MRREALGNVQKLIVDHSVFIVIEWPWDHESSKARVSESNLICE